LAGSRSSKQSRGSISSAAGSNDSFSLAGDASGASSHGDQGGDSSNEAHRASAEVAIEASDHGSADTHVGSAHESEDEGSIGSIGGLTTM